MLEKYNFSWWETYEKSSSCIGRGKILLQCLRKYYFSCWGNAKKVLYWAKSPIIKMQIKCWRNAEKMQKEKRENAKRMLEKRRENFPPVLGSAKRGANSLGAVSTSADQHNQWSSNQRFFLLAIIKTNTFYNLNKYFLHFRQIYLSI